MVNSIINSFIVLVVGDYDFILYVMEIGIYINKG